MYLYKVFTSVEKGFNILGSLPIIAIFTSPIRATGSKIQMFVGGAMGFAGFVSQCVGVKEKKWTNLTGKGGELFLHGALNWIRALGEFILSFTIVGSIGLFIGQLTSPRPFAPIIRYHFN